MDQLKDLLPRSLQRAGASKRVTASLVARAVENAIAEHIPGAEGKVKARKIKNGIAHVSADASVFAEEVRMNEAEIIETINTKLGSQVIKQIKTSS